MTDRDCILVIDSDDSIRDLLEDYLRKGGRSVITAADITEALAMIQAHPVSVVLVDPGIDGNVSDMIDRLKSSRTHPRIILMSGQPTLNIAVDSFRRGIYDFIVKPFCLDDLKVVIERAAADASRQNTVADLKRRIQFLEAELLRHRAPLPNESEYAASQQPYDGYDDECSKRHHLQVKSRNTKDHNR